MGVGSLIQCKLTYLLYGVRVELIRSASRYTYLALLFLP